MVLEVQVLGVSFLLIMLYLTWLFYKKGQYGRNGLLFWTIVWIVGMGLLAFPSSSYRVLESLQFARTIDFYLTIGIMFFSALTFWNYAHVNRLENRLEELVRNIAVTKPTVPKRKK